MKPQPGSFATKLILLFSAIILVISFGSGIYSVNKFNYVLKTQIAIDLVAIAEGIGGQVYLFFDKIDTLASSWSYDGYIRQASEKIKDGNNTQQAQILSKYLLEKKLPLESSVSILEVLDSKLSVIASSAPARIGRNETEHAEKKSVEELANLKFGEVFITPVENDEEELNHPSIPMLHALVPIKSLVDDNQTIGFLLLHIYADQLNKIMQGTLQTELGALSGGKFLLNQKTSEAYLVNENKLMVTPSRFVENAILNQKVDTEPVKACLENKKEFSGRYKNYREAVVSGASMCLVKHKLILVAEIGNEEIFSELNNSVMNIIIFTAIIFLIGIMMIYLLSKRLLKNITAMSKIAAEVASGNLKTRITDIAKSSDETEDLAKAFNQMLDSVENSQIDLQKKIDELERFKKATVGRELAMIEIKDRLKTLEKKHEPKK